MYGYVASALRFSLVHTVSAVSDSLQLVGFQILGSSLVSRFSVRKAVGNCGARLSVLRSYDAGRLESNQGFKRMVAKWDCRGRVRPPNLVARSMEEAVNFLQATDATAVMRGSYGLSRSTRSVC